MVDLGEVLADSAMAEGKSYIEFLVEEFFVEEIASVLFLQCLVDKEPSFLADAVQLAESFLRGVDQLDVVCV